MLLKNNITEAVRSLASAKQRTILALIGIVIGIGSVIAMVSVGKIVQEEALRQFMELGTDLLTIEKERGGGPPGGGGRQGTSAPLKLAEVMALPEKCPTIGVVAPSISVWGNGATYAGKKLERIGMLGVTESFRDINKLRVSRGRFISDLDEQSRYCVIGATLGQELRKRGAAEPLGEHIRYGDAILTVVGVLDEVKQGGMRRFDPNETLYVHITTALRMAADPELSTILARVRPGTDNTTARNQAGAYFTALKKPVKVSSPEELIAQMEKQMRMFTLLLGAIGSISLIVGGVGVMNVMLVSVTERRREIGIRRALGATKGEIVQQFLWETVVLSGTGGLLGVLAGFLCGPTVTAFRAGVQAFFPQVWATLPPNIRNIEPRIAPWSIIAAFAISVGVGIVFGIYPARRAANMDPIEALRHE